MGENWEAALHWRIPKSFESSWYLGSESENGALAWRIDWKESILYPDSSFFFFFAHFIVNILSLSPLF